MFMHKACGPERDTEFYFIVFSPNVFAMAMEP